MTAINGPIYLSEVNRLYRQHNTAMMAVEVLLRENMALRQQVKQLQRERVLRALEASRPWQAK